MAAERPGLAELQYLFLTHPFIDGGSVVTVHIQEFKFKSCLASD